MSTSLLYHAFGIHNGFKYTRTQYENGAVIFVVSATLSTLHNTRRGQLFRCNIPGQQNLVIFQGGSQR